MKYWPHEISPRHGCRALIKALGQLGYRSVCQTGSHMRLHCEDPAHSITIPNHRPPRIGTLSAILADVAAKRKLDRDELIRQFPK